MMNSLGVDDFSWDQRDRWSVQFKVTACLVIFGGVFLMSYLFWLQPLIKEREYLLVKEQGRGKMSSTSYRNLLNSLLKLTKTNSKNTQGRRVKGPLEGFPLDKLQFMGVLEQGSKRWALVMTPEGLLSRVTVGEYMGQHHGKVVFINHQSLMIAEGQLQGFVMKTVGV